MEDKIKEMAKQYYDPYCEMNRYDLEIFGLECIKSQTAKEYWFEHFKELLKKCWDDCHNICYDIEYNGIDNTTTFEEWYNKQKEQL